MDHTSGTKPTVIILAAGESSRFWPMGDKNLIKFLGRSLLSLHYDQLVRLGATDVVVVTNGKNADAIRAVSIPPSLSVRFASQHGEGQGAAVDAAASLVGAQPVLIINGSDWYDDSFLARFLVPADGVIRLGAVKRDRYFPGGYLKFADDGSVTEIVEKPGEGNEPSNTVRIVADCVPDFSELAHTVSRFGSDPVCGYEKSLNAMIAEGHRCEAVISDTPWVALKYPWHVMDMMEVFLRTITSPSVAADAAVSPSAVITGPVVIESGARVMEGAKIVGPCWIGPGAIVGNNTMIRESMLGSLAVTGFNSDITRSWIGAQSWFHTNYVGDSVISDNVSFGSGTVTANLRLDEGEIRSIVKGNPTMTCRTKFGTVVGEGSRVGVNVSIMPGIKIGRNSFVAGGLALSCDVPDDSFVKPAGVPYEIIPNRTHAAESREQFRSKL